MKRILVNCGLLLLLVLVALYCYDAGKTHKILLENLDYAGEGSSFTALEAIEVSLDGGKEIFMLPDDRSFTSLSGKRHSLRIDLLDLDDKVIESREFQFNLRDLSEAMTINLSRAWHLGRV